MAVEVIDAVRKAELQAEQAEKNAASKREEILQKAREDALTYIEKAVLEEQARDDQFVRDAQRKGEETVKKSEIETGAEISRLKETAQRKQAEAYRMILAELV